MSKFHFNTKAEKFKAQMPRILDVMANNAVNHFKVINFDAGGFVDMTVNKWAPIKNSDGRRPLVQTGRMRESITVLSRSQYTRVVGSNVPYAKYHNSGTGRLPKRQFIGESKKLNIKNEKFLLAEIKKIV